MPAYFRGSDDYIFYKDNGLSRDLRKVLLEDWEPNPAYEAAFKAWLEYYNETEKFDQTICSYRDDHGIAYPTTYWERTQITKNAVQQRKILDEKLRIIPITEPELRRAKWDALDEHERTFKC